MAGRLAGGAAARAVLERMSSWRQRRRTRAMLWQLNERELKDIGITGRRRGSRSGAPEPASPPSATQ
jgi:hypothetical protein